MTRVAAATDSRAELARVAVGGAVPERARVAGPTGAIVERPRAA